MSFQKLLDNRVEVVSTAFRAARDTLREDIERQMKVIADNAHVAMEKEKQKKSKRPV